MNTTDKRVEEMTKQLLIEVDYYEEGLTKAMLEVNIRNTLTQYHQDLMSEVVENRLITALGMMSENLQRQALGQSMAYTEEDFQTIIKSK